MAGATTTRDDRAKKPSRKSRTLNVERLLQPDEVTCGPTCLRKVYSFYGLSDTQEQIVEALERNEDGGTLAVYLGIVALQRGLRARIYSYDLRIFDPTWYALDAESLKTKILARFPYLKDEKRQRAASSYVSFLEMGGELAFDELRHTLLRQIIDRGHPVLAGLSATHLYRYARERWDPEQRKHVDDDVAGEPTGHFVVISGYDTWGRRMTVVDPFEHAPVNQAGLIQVDSDRLINAIMLGDVTYDAVLLEVWPNDQSSS
jgi:hypothetical protein